MARVNYFKFIASFLITLVLTLPLYTANVHAALSVTVKNSDGVNDFVKEDDFLEFKAIASIQGDADITPDQIRI